MQHHIDEFSVTDLRHTLGEAWRVISERRWWFIIPFCIVTSVAFAGSHLVPRLYTASTWFERRNDPVMAALGGQKWTHAYEDQRKRIANDLADEQAIGRIVSELDLPKGAPKLDKGELTPAGLQQRAALISQIMSGLATSSNETSPNRDLIEIRLTLPDPAPAPAILRGIRERYIERARAETVEVLGSVQEFFRTEGARCDAQLAEIDKQLMGYVQKYPSIDPDAPDMIAGQREQLILAKIEEERKVAELVIQRSQIERQMERLATAAERAERKAEGEEETIPACEEDEGTTQPNPRYVELRREIAKIERDIYDSKSFRYMTDAHPHIQELRARTQTYSEELARTSPRIASDAAGLAQAPGETEASQEEQLKAALADIDAKMAERDKQVAVIEGQIADLRQLQSVGLEHRPTYMKLKIQSGVIRSERDSWQQQLAPISHILTVENSNRGVHFGTIKEASAAARPSSPDARMLMLICLAIGAAVGGLCVLLAELLDRSFRSVGQLSTALGIPVIESVDEIVTATARRRRLIRNLLVMPAVTLALLLAVVTTGALAYLSIESPQQYQQVWSMPARTVHMLLGQG